MADAMAKGRWLALATLFIASIAFAAFVLPYSNPRPPRITVERIGPSFNASDGTKRVGTSSRPSKPVKQKEKVPGPGDCRHHNSLAYGPNGHLYWVGISSDEGYWIHYQGCGPLTFDPRPDSNSEMAIDVEVSPSMPRVGQVVSFHIDARDIDARISSQCSVASYGENIGGPACLTSVDEREAIYGIWKPPPAAPPDRHEFEFRFAYRESGAYTATFDIYSGSGYKPICGFPNPFSDIMRVTVALVVVP